jgi:mRNA-degrading endonuclease RelE of RelBE toxin-antitoxin system
MRDDPYGGDTPGLKGMAGVLRRRVGSWRIFFRVESNQRQVVILGVKRRTSTTY